MSIPADCIESLTHSEQALGNSDEKQWAFSRKKPAAEQVQDGEEGKESHTNTRKLHLGEFSMGSETKSKVNSRNNKVFIDEVILIDSLVGLLKVLHFKIKTFT